MAVYFIQIDTTGRSDFLSRGFIKWWPRTATARHHVGTTVKKYYKFAGASHAQYRGESNAKSINNERRISTETGSRMFVRQLAIG